ncbi:MAG: PIN domain-containing protein [Kiritimatiellae bacterium]|nr:PIN domain-containing protein [Kiritimatiellia bacterium]
MSLDFIDSNIIVYANDGRDAAKQKTALTLIGEAMRSGTGVISTQVLQEYANVALGKLRQRQDVVLRQLTLLERLQVVPQTPTLVKRAVEIHGLYGISFGDSAIAAAAEQAGCERILSEDLNPGQFYGSVVVFNPFG